ncbi:Pisatin demethylase [Cytospora mali]|uniref:Pisatin demethylase n=1 Tax=Cytospora mali TaxID=578113 RepID=A0A194VKB0_CYTMA|nr:Pisatin demethylase [Valsa mali]
MARLQILNTPAAATSYTVTALTILLVIGIYVLYQCLFSSLARFPGPFWAKLTKAYRVYMIIRGHSHRDYPSLHKKYGPVVRVAPNELSIADPQAFREIYRAGNNFLKSDTHDVLHGIRGPFDLASERDPGVHAGQRRTVAHAYSMGSVARLEPQLDRAIGALMSGLDGLQGGEAVDLGYWLQLFAFDAIGRVSFSRSHGFLEARDDRGMFARLHATLRSAAWAVHVGWLFRLHQRLAPVIGCWLAAASRDGLGHGYSYQFARQEITARKDLGAEERGRDGGACRDLLAQLLDVQARKGSTQMDDASVASMLTTNLFNGPDTTTTALGAAVYLLIRHPLAYDRLMMELENISSFNTGEKAGISGADTSVMSWQQVMSCPYLDAVLHEAMRLYPSSGQTLDRVVPAGGMSIGGRFVPAGTVVGTSAWAIHRVPAIWGQDAEEFRPERWLDKEGEGLKSFFFAFGGGSRVCLGRNITLMELSKLLGSLLLRFRLELAGDTELTEDCA